MAIDVEAPEHEALESPSLVAELPYRKLTLARSLAEGWQSRHLLVYLGGEAIRRMFYMTFLGPLWLVIHVAMDIGSKTFLFGSVLNVKTPNHIPYIIFLLTGLLGWTLFQQSLNFGVRSYQRYRRYHARLHMPLVLLPIAASAQALLQFVMYLAVVIAGLAYYALRGTVYFETSPRLLFAPLGLVLCLLFSWGISLILAPLNYHRRDVRLVMRYVLQFWLYVTPVVYPLGDLHGALLLAAKVNPLAPMTEMIKYGLIGGGSIGLQFALWGAGAAVGTFVVGLVFVNRIGSKLLAKPRMTDDDDGSDDDL